MHSVSSAGCAPSRPPCPGKAMAQTPVGCNVPQLIAQDPEGTKCIFTRNTTGPPIAGDSPTLGQSVQSVAPWPVNPALLGRTQLELRYHTERVQGGDTATGLFSLSSLCPIINKKKRVSEITRNKLQMSGIFKQMFLSVRPGIDQVFSRRRPGPLPSRCMQQLAATRCG